MLKFKPLLFFVKGKENSTKASIVIYEQSIMKYVHKLCVYSYIFFIRFTYI